MSGATAAATVRSGQKQDADEAEDEDGTQHAKQFLLQATPSHRHSADYHRDSVRRTTSNGEQENNGAKVEEERKQNVEPLEAVHQKEEEVGKLEAGRLPRNGNNDAVGSGTGADWAKGQTFHKIYPETSKNGRKAEPLVEADLVAFHDARATAEQQRKMGPEEHLNPPPLQPKNESPLESPRSGARKAMAAARIARLWLNRKYNKYMDRDILADRLDLEDKLGRGCLKISIYVAMFILIITCLSLGIPSSEKLATKHLLEKALDLDTFLEIRTIDGLRDFLPELSKNIKVFSASSVTVAGTEILSQRLEFTDPVTINEFAPVMSQPSWTLSAWIERFAGGAGGSGQAEFLPIVRQPMATNRSLSCWGWFHPRQLRFGAHDFFEFGEISTQLEEIVEIPARPGEDLMSLAMETLTLSNGVATFYHNGEKVGEVTLSREMTDCINPDPVELGQADLAMAGVKYYSRSLTDNEVEEMYRGGQPLFELASGSGLPRLEQEELLQLAKELEKQGIALTETLEEQEEKGVVGTILGEPLQPDDPLLAADDPTFPPDEAPDAVLPGGDRTAPYLSKEERAKWEAGGKRTTGFLTGRWEDDAALEGKRYWSVFEDPIYVDGSALAQRLPAFEASTEGVSVSFWFKTTIFVRAYGPHVRMLTSPDSDSPSCTAGAEDSAEFNMQTELDWVLVQMRVGNSCVRDWRYLTYFDKETGRIRETYLLSAFAQESSPVTWRHLLYQYDGRSGSLKFFLDGKLVYQSADADPSYSSSYSRVLDLPLRRVSDIFSNMTVVPHSWSQGGDSEIIPGKMAHLRVYPYVLSDAEVMTVHESATWPSGGAVKQCVNPEVDENYFDTTNLDARRQSCAWYYRMQLRYSYVCRLKWVKSMCPVVCFGQRLCHDGRLKIGYTPEAEPKAYWLFDRIQYLKPKKEGETVFCRSHDFDVEKVLEACEAVARQEANGEESTLSDDDQSKLSLYRRFLDTEYPGIVRFDATNCTQFRELLDDPNPCTFNTSWSEEFEADYNRTKTWAISWWMRPKPGSYGMPTNFWFAVKFYNSMAPPMLTNHWTEIAPDLEPWMDAYTMVRLSSGSISRRRAAIWPTSNIDYVNQWTMYHYQFQELDNGRIRLCGGINANPMACYSGSATAIINPRQLIQAVEFTSELLVSPIKVSTEWSSKADVQMRFYRKVVDMNRVLGPLEATREPGTVPSAEEAQAGVESFNQRVALLAPPLMYQTRAKHKVCDRKVTSTFLEGQLELKRAALCQAGDACEWVTPEAIATCFDRDLLEDREYWGNPARSHGFAEFLYITDSPNVVRQNEDKQKTVVRTREFIGGLTMTASVLAMFHSPVTGLTTAVELSADVASPDVKTSVDFLHVGFVDESRTVMVVLSYTFLILLIIALLVNAAFMLRRYRQYRRLFGAGYKSEILDYSADIVQGTIVMAFCIFSLIQAMSSVSQIEDIISEIREVSWINRDREFAETVDQFFRGVDRFRYQLSFETVTNTIAVVILFSLLFQIFAATRLHPHTGVLVHTVLTTFLDLHHFFLLFMLINTLFAFAATWVFGPERDEFMDLKATLNTQFTLLLDPNLPDKYEEDPLLVAYVVSCTVVIFFFMLNFLLAVVVDGYMKVREQIQLNAAEFEFITDVVLMVYAKAKGLFQQWPRKKDLAMKLRGMRVKRICATHLRNQGLPVQGTVAMFNHYAQYKALQCAPPEWKGVFYNYDRADHLSVQSFQRMMNSVELLRAGMTAMQERLGVEQPPSPHHQHIPPSYTKSKRRGSVTPVISHRDANKRGSDSSATQTAVRVNEQRPAITASVDSSAHSHHHYPTHSSRPGLPTDVERLLPSRGRPSEPALTRINTLSFGEA